VDSPAKIIAPNVALFGKPIILSPRQSEYFNCLQDKTGQGAAWRLETDL
jgi:hypothetical protein